MVDKEKLLKKTKTIIVVEYIVVALVIYTIGILKFVDVIKTNYNRLLAYNIITIVLAAYLYFEFIWFLVSKRKRAKNDAIDRIIMIPGATYMVVFDIICFINGTNIDYPFVRYSVGAIMLFVATSSLTLGIYHFFKPGKQVMEMVEEEYKAKLEEEQGQNVEENKESSEN